MYPHPEVDLDALGSAVLKNGEGWARAAVGMHQEIAASLWRSPEQQSCKLMLYFDEPHVLQGGEFQMILMGRIHIDVLCSCLISSVLTDIRHLSFDHSNISSWLPRTTSQIRSERMIMQMAAGTCDENPFDCSSYFPDHSRRTGTGWRL